jgi:hypothetical protein
MSKRKRATQPERDDSTDDDAAKDDMVHVTSDLLAGSPDIFASKKTEAVQQEPRESPVEPTEASTTLTPTNGTEAAQPEPVQPEPLQAPPIAPAAPAPRRRPAGSSMAIGIVLVVIGVLALVVALTGVDMTQRGWPLYVLVAGLALLVAGFVRLGAVATVPGGVLTTLGVVLAYTNSSGHWTVWLYSWALVIPGGIGLGVYLQALRDRDRFSIRTGRTLIGIALMIFLIGFVFFESIWGISGRETFGPIGHAGLAVLLIIVGVILLVRSVQRSRQS